MTQTLTTTHSAFEVAQAEKAAVALETLVNRLSHDEAFSVALQENARKALADAGLSMEKEAMEALMFVDPERFDKACDALFELVDGDFLVMVGAPSCG
ncbi:hypothetical protein ACFQLX_23935 [Streptomyces polyrhachis]|uniref:Uncharacterized protein n=1 Tax=Streptomyces polyrhachis TaxID=1282885 RepID=A0ABW2GQF3_9ACTN